MILFTRQAFFQNFLCQFRCCKPAVQDDGHLNACFLHSLCHLARFLGRPIIYKFADSRLGHFLLLDISKVQKAEDYFREHGSVSTFVGRLITVIRQLISIPAGLSKMKIFPFTLYTFLGATIWNCVLAFLGYLAHGQKDLIEKYNSELAIALLAAGVLFIAYMVWNAVKPRKKN